MASQSLEYFLQIFVPRTSQEANCKCSSFEMTYTILNVLLPARGKIPHKECPLFTEVEPISCSDTYPIVIYTIPSSGERLKKGNT